MELNTCSQEKSRKKMCMLVQYPDFKAKARANDQKDSNNTQEFQSSHGVNHTVDMKKNAIPNCSIKPSESMSQFQS